MSECKECRCGEDYFDELSRLEVLTDHVELAQQQRAKGSPHTDSWADYRTVTKWKGIIDDIRKALPVCAVKDFDETRTRQKEFTAKIIRDYDRSH